MAAANYFGIFRLRLFQIRKMFLGNNQHMRRGFRVDVVEGVDVIVFINLLRGNLAAKNTAEKAIAARFVHRSVTITKKDKSRELSAGTCCWDANVMVVMDWLTLATSVPAGLIISIHV